MRVEMEGCFRGKKVYDGDGRLGDGVVMYDRIWGRGLT